MRKERLNWTYSGIPSSRTKNRVPSSVKQHIFSSTLDFSNQLSFPLEVWKIVIPLYDVVAPWYQPHLLQISDGKAQVDLPPGLKRINDGIGHTVQVYEKIRQEMRPCTVGRGNAV